MAHVSIEGNRHARGRWASGTKGLCVCMEEKQYERSGGSLCVYNCKNEPLIGSLEPFVSKAHMDFGRFISLHSVSSALSDQSAEFSVESYFRFFVALQGTLGIELVRCGGLRKDVRACFGVLLLQSEAGYRQPYLIRGCALSWAKEEIGSRGLSASSFTAPFHYYADHEIFCTRLGRKWREGGSSHGDDNKMKRWESRPSLSSNLLHYFSLFSLGRQQKNNASSWNICG